MSHEEPGTPKARQALLHADLGAPPFKYVVGEEPVTPATTVLQPSATTARNQTSFNGASSTATRSEAKNHVALASREQSTAHTQQWGANTAPGVVVPRLQDRRNSMHRKGTYGPDEWERSDIPVGWAPVPVFKVSTAAGTESAQLMVMLAEALNQKPFKIKCIQMDTGLQDGESVGIVRLDAEQGDPPCRSFDVDAVAKQAAEVVNNALPAANGRPLSAIAEHTQVCLCLANIPSAMLSTDRLKLALQSYGTLERLCIIRNPHGATKGYAIVEFSLPSQAKNAYNSIMHDSMVSTAASDIGSDHETQPDISFGRCNASGIDQAAVPSHILVAWFQAGHVSEYFSKALFLICVPDSYLVSGNQLRNALAEAAQCAPDEISEIWRHEDVSSSSSFDRASDPRCGRPWGCVRFMRADHCDAAFRNLEARAANGSEGDVLRVVFAPPNFATSQEAVRPKRAPEFGDFGIKGPGYAPGFDPASKHVPVASPDGQQGSVTSQSVAKACKGASQESSKKRAVHGPSSNGPECGKPGKGRPLMNTGHPTKPGRSQKRSQRGGRLSKGRPSMVSQCQIQHRGPRGYNAVLPRLQGHCGSVAPVRPPRYLPAPQPSRPMLGSWQGGFELADRQHTHGSTSRCLPQINALAVPPPSAPRPMHMGHLVMTPQWAPQAPAVAISSATCSRPEQHAMSRPALQYPVSVGHQSQMCQHGHTSPQVVQIAEHSVADPAQYVQSLTPPSFAHDPGLCQQQLYPDVTPAGSYFVSSGPQVNHCSTPRASPSALCGQLPQLQAAHQPNQYASGPLCQQVPVLHPGQRGDPTGFDAQHVGQKRGFQVIGNFYPSDQNNTHAYNYAQNPGAASAWSSQHAQPSDPHTPQVVNLQGLAGQRHQGVNSNFGP